MRQGILQLQTPLVVVRPSQQKRHPAARWCADRVPLRCVSRCYLRPFMTAPTTAVKMAPTTPPPPTEPAI